MNELARMLTATQAWLLQACIVNCV